MRFLCKFLPRIKLFGNVYYYYNYYHFWLSYVDMYREWCCRSEADDAFGCHGHGQKIFTQSSTSSRNFNFSLQKHNSILIDIQAGSICKDIGRKCMYFKWTFYTFVCITERYAEGMVSLTIFKGLENYWLYVKPISIKVFEILAIQLYFLIFPHKATMISDPLCNLHQKKVGHLRCYTNFIWSRHL